MEGGNGSLADGKGRLGLDLWDHSRLRGRNKQGIAERHPVDAKDDGFEARGAECSRSGRSLRKEGGGAGIAHAKGPFVGREGIGIGDSEGDFGVAT
jgi:hypothetical protein